MSTLAEIEEAIVRLPAGQIDELASWLDRQRAMRFKTSTKTRDPDFALRAARIWGNQPVGKSLSELISESRG